MSDILKPKLPPIAEIEPENFVEDADEVQEPASTSPNATLSIHPAVANHYRIPVEIIMGIDNHYARCQAVKPYALRMYIDQYPTKYIAKMLGLPIYTVARWRLSEDWQKKREIVEQSFTTALVQAQQRKLLDISTDTIDIIARVIKKTKKLGDEDLNMRHAETLSRIFSNLDKVMRLTAGAPTEIIQQAQALGKPLTKKELREILEGDPFMRLEDIIDVTPPKKGEGDADNK